MNTIQNNQLTYVSLFSAALALGIAFMGSAYAQQLPDTGFSVEFGDATYNKTGNTGNLNVLQDNSIVAFADGLNIGINEVLNVLPDAAVGNSSWSVLIRETSDSQSHFNGTLNLGLNAFFVNKAGILFGQDFQVDFNGLNSSALVASTYDISNVNFGAGNFQFNRGNSTGSIDVKGLEAVGGIGQILLLSDTITIDGVVDVSQGHFGAAAGEEVIVSFGNNSLLQFDVTKALNTSANDTVIEVTDNGEINSGSALLKAMVDDPTTLVINNRGVIKAQGISVNDVGEVSLVGVGGTFDNSGTIDARSSTNGDGNINISAVRVNLGGKLLAGTGELAVEIGNKGSLAENEQAIGILRLRGDAEFEFARANITGLGGLNQIEGAANYTVNGINSGTLGIKGIGIDNWQNVGAVSFANLSSLRARADQENTFTILESGVLLQEFGGSRFGLIQGGNLEDTFIVAGEVESLRGKGDRDSFQLQGGRVNKLIDGGRDIDSLIDVINPRNINSPAGSGNGDLIASWVNIEEITAFVPGDPVSSIISPQKPFSNLDGEANASLGLIGGDELRLPCGYRTRIPTAEEKSAAAEEDCFNDGNPEGEMLMSSIIHFDNDSAAITSESAERLDKVSEFVVKSNDIQKVVISAHTDDNAPEEYNMKLSEKRANSTAAYMQGKQVTAEKIEMHHYGESLPAKPNSSDENRAYNRRARIELEK